MERLDLDKIQLALDYWGELPAQFQQLTPDQQKRYLFVQGYQCFPDLLAHVSAWWERGMRLIAQYRAHSSFTAPAVNVDEFNAQAVAHVRGKSGDEVPQAFENARQRFLELLGELSDKDQQDPRIIRQIEMEVIAHFQEHKIE